MSDTVLRDEIARIVGSVRAHINPRDGADSILAIPAIKEALAFHESCLAAFAVNGEFTVTKESLAADREGVWK